MSFDPTTFKVSFLMGDIISSNPRPDQPLPDLTCEESEQLRSQLLTEISWLREYGESERSHREQTFIDRVLESLDKDDRCLGHLDKGKNVEKGKEKEEMGTPFAFTDVSGITIVLRLRNLTDERLLDIYGSIKQQIIARRLESPDSDFLSPSPSPVLRATALAKAQIRNTKPVGGPLAPAMDLSEEWHPIDHSSSKASSTPPDSDSEVFHELEDTSIIPTAQCKVGDNAQTNSNTRDIFIRAMSFSSLWMLGLGIFLGLTLCNKGQIQEYVSRLVDLVPMKWGYDFSVWFMLAKEGLKLFAQWFFRGWEATNTEL